MGLGVAIASLIMTAVATVKQQEAASDARKEQKKQRQEQQAVNAEQAAREKRQQIREERIRRAQILQASENTGVAGSSGEMGATGNLSTQLSANLGFTSGQQRHASNMSIFQQKEADALGRGQMWAGVGNISSSIFSASGGFGAFKGTPKSSGTQAPAPVVEMSPKPIK